MTEGTYSAGVFALPCLDKYSTTESHAIVKFLRNNYEGIINSMFCVEENILLLQVWLKWKPSLLWRVVANHYLMNMYFFSQVRKPLTYIGFDLIKKK